MKRERWYQAACGALPPAGAASRCGSGTSSPGDGGRTTQAEQGRAPSGDRASALCLLPTPHPPVHRDQAGFPHWHLSPDEARLLSHQMVCPETQREERVCLLQGEGHLL